MGFRLTREAEEDVIGIAEDGLRLFGEAQAERYHRALFRMFGLIAGFPRMARERMEISPSVRIHPYKAHLIVYIVADDDDVLIVRVRHGHEDWAEQAR